MPRSWILLLIALVGCAENVCDRTAAWAERCKVPWTDADDRTCRKDLRVCTAAEKDKLDAFWFCMDKQKFFECTDAPVDTGLGTAPPAGADALLACEEHLQGVSLSCSGAIGIDAGTYGGLRSPTPTTEAR